MSTLCQSIDPGILARAMAVYIQHLSELEERDDPRRDAGFPGELETERGRAELAMTALRKADAAALEIEPSTDAAKEQAASNRMFDTFEQWMEKVDAVIERRTGWCTSSDLPDQRYAAWYEAGVAAKTAADRALDDVGFSTNGTTQ